MLNFLHTQQKNTSFLCKIEMKKEEILLLLSEIKVPTPRKDLLGKRAQSSDHPGPILDTA